MPITARFAADFEAFYTACAKAETSLSGVQEFGNKAESQLQKLANSLNGSKLIQDGAVAAEAVARVGGAATLTASQLQQVGAMASDAAEKLIAMGQDVPPKIAAIAYEAEASAASVQKMGSGAGDASNQVAGLGHSLGEVDRILAVFGVHITPEVRALKEFGESADKSAGQLGLITTGALTVAAAVAGWKLGRAISEFFELDKAIGDATARLLGFGDVAAQVAGSGADALAKASRTVGYEVHNLSDALAINAANMVPWRSQTQQSAEAIARWREELAKVSSGGDMPQLTKDLASQNFELKDLAARYHVTVEALQFLQRETAKASDIEAAAAERISQANARKLRDLGVQMQADQAALEQHSKVVLAIAKLDDEYQADRVSHGGTANEIAIAQIHKWEADTVAAAVHAGTATSAFYAAMAQDAAEKLNAVGVDWDLWKTRSRGALEEVAANALKTYEAMISSGQFLREDLDKQREKWWAARDAARGYGDAGVDAGQRVAAAQEAAIQKLAETRAAADAAAAALRRMGNSITYDLSNDAGIANYRKLNPGANIQWSNAQIEAFIGKGGTLQGLIELGVINPYAAFTNAPGFADGGPTGSGGPAILHPDEFVVPKSGALVSGGSRGPMTVNVMLPDGRVLASVVVDSLSQDMMQDRLWPTR